MHHTIIAKKGYVLNTMEVLKSLISQDQLGMAMTVVFISSLLYSGANVVYDVVSKTDIENSLTYRGKDRIIVSITLCVLFALITVVFAFDELTEMYSEFGIFITLVTVILASLSFSIIALLMLSLIFWLVSFTGLHPKYEVEIEENDFWRVIKVTKDGRVILKKEDLYFILSEVKDLDHKVIRLQQNPKKKKSK